MNLILSNEHASAAIWIEAQIKQPAQIGTACRAALVALEQLQNQRPQDQIGMTIAFGADFWQTQAAASQAPELKNFPSYGTGNTIAPATQHDLLIHIQSNQHDSNFALALSVLDIFGAAIEVAQETQGFRRHENRGLDGFVDGTENPHGDEKIQSIALNQHGGSYIVFQRYQHDLAKWNSHSVAEQEQSVARSKQSDEEFAKTDRHPRSHIARTNIKENGVGLKIVRRSLPYGSASGEHGLAFVAYASSLHNIEAQLQHMFGDVPDGLTDLLLERLSQAKTGAYYYAPSVATLQQM